MLQSILQGFVLIILIIFIKNYFNNIKSVGPAISNLHMKMRLKGRAFSAFKWQSDLTLRPCILTLNPVFFPHTFLVLYNTMGTDTVTGSSV